MAGAGASAGAVGGWLLLQWNLQPASLCRIPGPKPAFAGNLQAQPAPHAPAGGARFAASAGNQQQQNFASPYLSVGDQIT